MLFELENITDDHLIIVVVGYVIVFLSLFLLWLVFYNLPKILQIRWDKISGLFKGNGQQPKENEIEIKAASITGEETAAISAAIFMFIEQLHDEEHTVLTIHKISKRYSPWSSKIYNVINGLNKRF
jgi:glutaconyl-CoA/methylmalonyl-CoA decarboxylase subunit delta